MPAPYTDITFTNAREGGITARKLNKLRDDLSTAISGGGTGTGDMTKAVYDTNSNNVVDTCDSLAWAKLTGVPSTFPPDSTAMLKSVYDTNGDGISDHAALSDTAPWAGITGKPATFPPDSTAMLKSVYDTNGDGVSDHAALADAAPWTGVTGKPSTFPPDSTAMLKSVYDTNNDGISDHAALSDAVPWTGVTGKPATFPPDSTAMLKSVYDTNNDGISDHAALADSASAVAWTGITGKPASFTPGAHASTHLDNGTDAIAVVTTVRTGLAPKLSGIAGTYLDGTGAYSSPSGSGDMTKSVYDTNGNGVVDTADAIPWASVTGKPAGSLVDPGTWTNLSYGTGWTQNTTAQYRVEVNGTFSKVIAQGIINYASGAASLAFTLPVGARPGVARGCVLAGFDSSGDVQLFQATVATSGAVNIVPMVRQSFSWPSATNGSVYLDNLTFAL
jgi:hypothetical protein